MLGRAEVAKGGVLGRWSVAKGGVLASPRVSEEITLVYRLLCCGFLIVCTGHR